MYGTVARMRLKPGMEERMRQLSREFEDARIPGYLFEYVFKLDGGDNDYILVAGFESRDAYMANANDPKQHERYLQYRELLQADPEWNDGEIVDSYMKKQ
jgi:hypothetical protein